MIMINNNERKFTLLKDICDFYDYELSEKEDGKIRTYHNDDYEFEYKNVDIALCDWYRTLMESNEIHEDYSDINRYTCWTIEDIDFVRGIIKDEALKLVTAYCHTMQIPIVEVELYNKYDVTIHTKKDGKEIFNKMDIHCNVFIETAIKDILEENKGTEEELNKFRLDRDIMLTYVAMIKDYREELIALGKLARDCIKSREFYEYVVWEDFSDETYMSMGYKLYKEKDILKELAEIEIEYSCPSVEATDLLTEIADNGVEEEGYEFNYEYRFVKENKIDKGMVNNMNNTLQVKYDVEFKYMGTEFVGVGEFYKVECNRPIPCVKDDKLELVANIYSEKTAEETIRIKYVEINNILHHIKDIKYWFGINTEELFERLELVITSNTTPSDYIKIDGNVFPVECLGDILDLNVSGNISECKFSECNENLFAILEHYIGVENRTVYNLQDDLNIILTQINDDMDTLDELLKINSNPNYWTKENIYYYEGYKRWEAIEEYLEYEENIPNKVLDYLDLEGFLDKETIISEVLELNDCVILY